MTKLEDVRLREIPKEDYESHKDGLLLRFRKRAAHFYTEQERVEKGAKCDLEAFGQLKFESGHRTFYQQEGGIPETETIYNILKETEGVYSVRPSGAGYRGTIIGLVNPDSKEYIEAQIDAIYPDKHPEYKDVYQVNFCQTDDGARFVYPR